VVERISNLCQRVGSTGDRRIVLAAEDIPALRDGEIGFLALTVKKIIHVNPPLFVYPSFSRLKGFPVFPSHEAIPKRINVRLYLLHIPYRQVLKPALCPQALFNHKTPDVVRDIAGTGRLP
jgi:hypothetical protein